MATVNTTDTKHTHTDACPVLVGQDKSTDNHQRVIVRAARAPYGCDYVKGRAWTIGLDDGWAGADGTVKQYRNRYSIPVWAAPLVAKALLAAFDAAGRPALPDGVSADSAVMFNPDATREARQARCGDDTHARITAALAAAGLPAVNCPQCGGRLAPRSNGAGKAAPVTDLPEDILSFI